MKCFDNLFATMLQIKIMLSVKDALFLKESAEVKIFLDNKIECYEHSIE